MINLINILKRYRARDYVYFLTPPILYKIFSKLTSKTISKPKSIDDSNFSQELSLLKEKGMNYFIDDDVIKMFCDKSRKQLLESSYGEIENDIKHYLDDLDKNGYVVVKNIFDKGILNKINSSLSHIIDKEVDHLKKFKKKL